MSCPSAEVLRARAYLSRVAEPPSPALIALVEALGPVEAANRVRAADVPDLVAGETAARRTVDRSEADLAAAHAAGRGCSCPKTRRGRTARSPHARSAVSRPSRRRWRCGYAGRGRRSR